MSENYPVDSRNRLLRIAKRASYDRETIHQLLDASLVGYVAFVDEQSPVVIPMMFAREHDRLLFHGSVKSRIMNVLGSGREISIATMQLDGLVLAKSLFHHSMNYRSVCVFGKGSLVTDASQKLHALKLITDKVMVGRWDDARQPSANELKATSVVAVDILTASAKSRSGDPIEDRDDLDRPTWSGTIPLDTTAMKPVPAALPNQPAEPDYFPSWFRQFD